jgi:hypothetical protein
MRRSSMLGLLKIPPAAPAPSRLISHVDAPGRMPVEARMCCTWREGLLMISAESVARSPVSFGR